jgi:putative protease
MQPWLLPEKVSPGKAKAYFYVDRYGFCDKHINRRAPLELCTSAYTLKQLEAIDLAPFDGICLGDPFSIEYPQNLCLCPEDLERAVHRVKEAGRMAYLCTFAVPRNRDLPGVESLFAFVRDRALPIDAIEIHNSGLLSLAGEILPGVPIHMGCLSNIYTDATVELYKAGGAVRVAPSFELSLDELEMIRDRSGVDVEILAHGKMVLGISERCPALTWLPPEERAGMSEEELCRKPFQIESDKMTLTVRGRATLSGRDVCILEHLPAFVRRGFGTFRIEGGGDPAYLREAGRAYRHVLDELSGGREVPAGVMEDCLGRLAPFSPGGFCNGYYFRMAGSEYVPAGQGG